MITTKPDLKEYMLQDKIQLGISRRFPKPFSDKIWRYEIILRKYEYWLNKNHRGGVLTKIIRLFYHFLHSRYSAKLGISIPPNTCGKGLSIAHASCIFINHAAEIGDNLRIHEGVTIGASGGKDAPKIGDCVFLGTGCKIIGNVKIASHCAVGANAVVVKDVLEEGITVAGVPAKKISDNNSDRFVFGRLKKID